MATTGEPHRPRGPALDHAAEASRLHAEAEDDDHAALVHAFQLFDDAQADRARALLTSHGFTVPAAAAARDAPAPVDPPPAP